MSDYLWHWYRYVKSLTATSTSHYAELKLVYNVPHNRELIIEIGARLVEPVLSYHATTQSDRDSLTTPHLSRSLSQAILDLAVFSDNATLYKLLVYDSYSEMLVVKSSLDEVLIIE